MTRKIKTAFIAVTLTILTFTQSGFCGDLSSVGLMIEEGTYETKRIFYEKSGKKLELKVKGESFIAPKEFKRSGGGRFILFIDSLEDNEFDSYVYLYDTARYRTGGLLMRNVKVSYIHRIEWYDSHSFLINILSDKYFNFTIGNRGPFYNGTYLIKFDDDFNVVQMNKLEW